MLSYLSAGTYFLKHFRNSNLSLDCSDSVFLLAATVRVEMQQPPVTHEVRMKDFQAWLKRKSGSPAEMVLRDKIVKDTGGVALATRR